MRTGPRGPWWRPGVAIGVLAVVLALAGCAVQGPGATAGSGDEPAGEATGPETHADPANGSAGEGEDGGTASGDGDGEGDAPAAEDPAVERAAMECVTGAWVAETAALQEMFDQAMADAGVSDYELVAEGSIVYEFLEHGFGLNVIPTSFGMRMPTQVGDVLGTIGGQASGLWTVKGEYIHAAGEDWQNGLTMRWTFNGEEIAADSGTQDLVDGFTDVDRFECTGDVLVLQSAGSPPLSLTRMVDVS